MGRREEDRSSYWMTWWYLKLKEEALNRTLWRMCSGRGCGPVVRLQLVRNNRTHLRGTQACAHIHTQVTPKIWRKHGFLRYNIAPDFQSIQYMLKHSLPFWFKFLMLYTSHLVFPPILSLLGITTITAFTVLKQSLRNMFSNLTFQQYVEGKGITHLKNCTQIYISTNNFNHKVVNRQ